MTPILVSNCTTRKSVPSNERLQAADLPCGTTQEVARTWNEWVDGTQRRLPAEQMYQGRGFVEAKNASKSVGGQHWIISAGLGLVSVSDLIPGYDLTVSGNSASHIRTKIQGEVFSPQQWWLELTKCQKPPSTLLHLIRDNHQDLVVLALPSNYLSMVLDDLSQLNYAELARLRLVGAPEKTVPPHLRPLWLPYDERLDGPDSPISGTRSDFPQRAARHFLETIWPTAPYAASEIHSGLVRNALSTFARPSNPRRERLDDAAIVALIERFWEQAEGRSSRLLRILRDEKCVACEQSRFKKLVHIAKAKWETA